MKQGLVSSGMIDYHYSDGAFGDGSDANITIHYYQKMDRFANNSNFTV